MTQFESLQASDKNKNQLLDEEELQELINAVDTEQEATLLFLELEITEELVSLKDSLIDSLQIKILDGDKKALGLFRSLSSVEPGTSNSFLTKIKDALDNKIDLIVGFPSICAILQLNNQARDEYGIKLLVNKINLKPYSRFFTEISFLLNQFKDYQETQKMIQIEGIIALGKIANAESIQEDTTLEKYRILFARKQSLSYMQERNKPYYEGIEKKSVELQKLYTELQETKKQMTDASTQRPGALPEALSRGVVPILGPVMQGYKVKRIEVDGKIKVLLQKHDTIVQSIKKIELSIYKEEQEKIKQNNLIGILYQFRAITESDKKPVYPTTYTNETDRAGTLLLIRTDPGLQYLHSMYESMGIDFIRLLINKTDAESLRNNREFKEFLQNKGGLQSIQTKDQDTNLEVLHNENLKNGVILFLSFHAHEVALKEADIKNYSDTELGLPLSQGEDGGIQVNEYDVIQALQSGEIQTIKEDTKSGTMYGVVSPERKHLSYLNNLTGEQYIQNSLDELSTGRTPLIYVKQITDNAGNTTLSYSIQRPFDINNLEEIAYTNITSEKVNESNNYLVGLDKTLTEYGNVALYNEIGFLQAQMEKVNPLFDLLASLDGGTGQKTSEILQGKVREVASQVDFSSLLQTCTVLKDDGLPYLQELQRVFDTRKGAVLTPAESAFEKKIQDLVSVCENALQTYQSLYDLLKNPDNIQPDDLKKWLINNGIPMLIAIGAAVAAITVSVTTFGIGSGVGGMILTAGIGTAAGMAGNELGHYASTKIGQSVYGDTYGNYTMLQKYMGGESSYTITQLAKQYGMDFAQGFTVTLLTLGLARGVVSSIEQQALQPGVLGNGARRLVNLLRSDQELFTQAGHSSFMKKFGKEYLEELGEEGVGETAKKIDSRLGFVAEVLINSKIQPNFIVDGKSASIQSADTPTGKKVTIQCDGETFLENGEKHYLDLRYTKSISKTGSVVFTNTLKNKKGETYTHTVELVPSTDPYIVREINAVINPADGYVIKIGDTGEYTVEDKQYAGNAIDRHRGAITTLANLKGMIVSDLGNGDISIRFGNQEVIIKNSQEALQKSRIEKIKEYEPILSPENYCKRSNRRREGWVMTEMNNMDINQRITRKWSLQTNELGIRYATVHLTSGSVDGTGGGMDPMYLASFPPATQQRILLNIQRQINSDPTQDIYIFIQDSNSIKNVALYTPALSEFEQRQEDQFFHIIGRRQALRMCSEHQSREAKQIILEKFGFSANQQTELKKQPWFYNSGSDSAATEQTNTEVGQTSHQIAQELDKEEELESETHLLGGAAAVWENMTNDEGRTTNAMTIVNQIVPGTYNISQIQAIGRCVQQAHETANDEVQRFADETVNYIYDRGGISIPNRTLRGLRLKLDVLKTGLSALVGPDGKPLFTDKQVSEIAKTLMRSGVCAEPVGINNAVKQRIQNTLSEQGETIQTIEEIGSGGNGKVYLVTTVSGKTFAMKLIDAAGSETYYREEIQRQFDERQKVRAAGIPTFSFMQINTQQLTVTTEYVAGAFDPLNNSSGTMDFKKRGITQEQLIDVSRQLDRIFTQAENNNIMLSEEDVFFFVYDSATNTYKVIVGDYDNVGQDLGRDSEDVKRGVIKELLPYVVESQNSGNTTETKTQEDSNKAADELLESDSDPKDDVRDGKRNSMTEAQQETIIANGNMSNEDKIRALGIEGCFDESNTLNELGREVAHRIQVAHEIGSERGYGHYTRKDIQDKMRILRFGDTTATSTQTENANKLLQGEKAKKAIEEGYCGYEKVIDPPVKSFKYNRNGTTESFSLNTCYRSNKPEALKDEMQAVRVNDEQYSIDIDKKMTDRQIRQYQQEIDKRQDPVKDLEDDLESFEIERFQGMQNILIESVRMLTLAELENAMQENARDLSGYLAGKTRTAFLDDDSQGSKSRLTMTKLFCNKVQQSSSTNTFTRNTEADNNNLYKLHDSRTDYIVISDDASYSGEQVLASIDTIVASFSGSVSDMPPIIINIGFASDMLLNTLKTDKYKAFVDAKKIIIPAGLQNNPSRRIQNISTILNDKGYSVQEYNNILKQIQGRGYTQPGNYGETAVCPGLEKTQTTTYCERKIPNNKSLINPVRNMLIPFTPIYKK